MSQWLNFQRCLNLTDNKSKILSTGTTTVGLLGKDCVVLAADQKSTMGYMVSSETINKVHSINDKFAVTIAGTVGDALTIVRYLKSQAKLYEIERGNAMTPRAGITLLANILNGNRYYPYMAGFILGGFNAKPELYDIDAVGGVQDVSNFTSVGSGQEFAIGYLEEQFKEGMAQEKLVELAVKAVKTARKRDIASGGKSVTVIVISKDGLKELTHKDIEKYLN